MMMNPSPWRARVRVRVRVTAISLLWNYVGTIKAFIPILSAVVRHVEESALDVVDVGRAGSRLSSSESPAGVNIAPNQF